MATIETKCDDCKRQNCPQRLVGAVCSLNSELAPLIQSVNSRDPIMVSRFIVSVVGSEYDRYEKAKAVERLGEIEEVDIVTKSGEIQTIKRRNSVDNNVSTLAMNIIKAGKMLNEIMNPAKNTPFFQQNIQNNYSISAADQIRELGEKEKQEAIKFIDEKLDAKREN